MKISTRQVHVERMHICVTKRIHICETRTILKMHPNVENDQTPSDTPSGHRTDEAFMEPQNPSDCFVPPPPIKFNRKQADYKSSSAFVKPSHVHLQNIRRNIHAAIISNELCPVSCDQAQQDLWVVLDKIYLQ